MTIELDPEAFIASIGGDRGWSLVLESRGAHHLRLVALDVTGAARGFIQLRRSEVPALIDALVSATEHDR